MDGENRNDSQNTINQSPVMPRIRDFTGSFTHFIDAKGRVIVPSVYKKALGEAFTIAPTRNFKAIALYPNIVFDRIVDQLMEKERPTSWEEEYMAKFAKFSYREVQPDGQGRILLPAKLRQFILGDAKELEISGAWDHVRLMDNVQADAQDLEFLKNMEKRDRGEQEA